MKVTVDDSEFRAFAANMGAYPAVLQRHVGAVVKRGAMNIKRDLVAKMRASAHFKVIAPAINFDVRVFSFAGTGGYEAEIGPEKGSPGSLANVAYFGTSRGGGTVEDPARALEREAPAFERELGNLMEEMFP